MPGHLFTVGILLCLTSSLASFWQTRRRCSLSSLNFVLLPLRRRFASLPWHTTLISRSILFSYFLVEMRRWGLDRVREILSSGRMWSWV